MGAFLFVAVNACAGIAAYCIAELTMPGSEAWRRHLSAFASFPLIVFVLILSLGLAGWLFIMPLATLTAGLAASAGGLWLVGKPAKERLRSPPEEQARLDLDQSLFRSIAIVFLGGFGALWLFKLVGGGTHFQADDLSYHAAAIAQWIIDGKIGLSPFNYHAYYPLNAEILSLWFALPFHADGLGALAPLYWGALLVAAGAALVVGDGHSRSSALFIGALLLASPAMLSAASTFSAVDIAGPACVLAAVALVRPAGTNDARRISWSSLVYAGLLTGFAVGCKVTFAPAAATIFVWLILNWRAHQASRAVIGAFVFGFASVLTGSFWYARNFWLTSNPLFPAAIGPFAGPFGRGEQAGTELWHWVLLHMHPADVLHVIDKHMDWPFGLGLIAVAGYGSALAALVWPRAGTALSPSASPRGGQFLLLAVGIVLLLGYPLMPFSGTLNEPNASLTIDLRYVIAPFAIGIVLFAQRLQQGVPLQSMWIALALLAAATTRQSFGDPGTLLAVACGSVLWLAMRQSPSSRVSGVPIDLRVAALGLLVIALAILQPVLQRQTDLAVFSTGAPKQPVGLGWQNLEKLPRYSRIAYFGRGAYQYYPLYGRELQLRPLPCNGDGTTYEPMHLAFRHTTVSWWGTDDHFDANAFVSNLKACGADYAFVTKWDGGTWPIQAAALAASDSARLTYDDGYSRIFALGDAAKKERR